MSWMYKIGIGLLIVTLLAVVGLQQAAGYLRANMAKIAGPALASDPPCE